MSSGQNPWWLLVPPLGLFDVVVKCKACQSLTIEPTSQWVLDAACVRALACQIGPSCVCPSSLPSGGWPNLPFRRSLRTIQLLGAGGFFSIACLYQGEELFYLHAATCRSGMWTADSCRGYNGKPAANHRITGLQTISWEANCCGVFLLDSRRGYVPVCS